MAAPVPLTDDLRLELASLNLAATSESPLNLLFASGAARTQAEGITAHAVSRRLPDDSFVRVSEHVLVSSPELAYVQMSRSLPIGKLIHAACELCGTYAQVGFEGRLVERAALTDVGNLRAFAEQMFEDPGALALRALRYARNGSASPMESTVMLLLCLPGRMGGYGLPFPVLNLPVTLSSEAYAIYPCKSCRLDLAWPARNFSVEYDGIDSHTGSAHAKDVARAMALRLEGMDVLTVAKQQVYSETAFEQVAVEVARRLGTRLRTRSEHATEARRQLRRELGLL